MFRSAVDSWAIKQLFPIVPIHRLDEEPTVPATLADLTCDSDGKVDKFINPKVGGWAGGWVEMEEGWDWVEAGSCQQQPGLGWAAWE